MCFILTFFCCSLVLSFCVIRSDLLESLNALEMAISRFFLGVVRNVDGLVVI